MDILSKSLYRETSTVRPIIELANNFYKIFIVFDTCELTIILRLEQLKK